MSRPRPLIPSLVALVSLVAVASASAEPAPSRAPSAAGPAATGPRQVQPGEVIVIEPPPRPPAVHARALNDHPRKTLPYSDRAIDSDAWTRAWLLLEIDPSGRVTRFKFLERPGYDLEPIAARQAFALRFSPARDAKGHPIRTWLVWGMEWPSYGWLIDMTGTASHMPPMVGVPGHSLAAYVPCKGSGPMDLGSIHPTYRDCSTPDLSKNFDAVPWIRPRALSRR